MKKLMSMITILIIIQEVSYAQVSQHYITPDASTKKMRNHEPVKYSSEYYAIQSSKSKTAGWVLLSLGSVLATSGYLLYHNQKEYNLSQMGEAVVTSVGGQILMYGGASMVLISIPVFISAGNYKKKALAMSAMLKFETGKDLFQTGAVLKNHPAIGLSIQL